MRLRILITLLLLSLTACSDSIKDDDLKCRQGQIDLAGWNRLQNPILNLNGEWEYFPNLLLYPSDFRLSNYENPSYTDVPGVWDNSKKYNIEKGQGYATYRLIINSPEAINDIALKFGSIRTSYICWLNEAFLTATGVVGNSAESSVPQQFSKFVPISLNQGENELIIQISNYYDAYGGFWDPLLFGDLNTIQKKFLFEISKIFIIVGFMVFSILLATTLIIVSNQRTDLPAIIILGLSLMIRILLDQGHLLFNLLGSQLWHILFRIQYLSLTVGAISANIYILKKIHTKWKHINLVLFPLYLATTLIIISPPRIYSGLLMMIYAYMIIPATAVLFLLIFRRRKNFSDLTFTAITGIALLSAIYTLSMRILFNQPTIAVYAGLSLLILYAITETYLISFRKTRFCSEERERENKSVELLYSFIPNKIIDLFTRTKTKPLGGESLSISGTLASIILETYDKAMSVSLPEESFSLLNSLYGTIEPLIEKEGGIILSYCNNQLLVLFQDNKGSAYKAIRAAQEQIKLFNRRSEMLNAESLRCHCIIDKSDFIIGIAGSRSLLQPVLISDSKSSIDKITGIAKRLQIDFIISEDCFYHLLKTLERGSLLSYRLIGRTTFEGSSRSTTLYQILETADQKEKTLKESTKESLERGICEFLSGNFEKAELLFAEVIKKDSKDRVAQIYLERVKVCKKMEESDLLFWNGDL
ncbi:MAG: hypothetical protein PF637_11100 [Spirochaetes bacterium]|jgi:adenylate cyclase|nr:hypothetical protein [Spirochaetota bacterium]